MGVLGSLSSSLNSSTTATNRVSDIRTNVFGTSDGVGICQTANECISTTDYRLSTINLDSCRNTKLTVDGDSISFNDGKTLSEYIDEKVKECLKKYSKPFNTLPNEDLSMDYMMLI